MTLGLQCANLGLGVLHQIKLYLVIQIWTNYGVIIQNIKTMIKEFHSVTLWPIVSILLSSLSKTIVKVNGTIDRALSRLIRSQHILHFHGRFDLLTYNLTDSMP